MVFDLGRRGVIVQVALGVEIAAILERVIYSQDIVNIVVLGLGQSYSAIVPSVSN